MNELAQFLSCVTKVFALGRIVRGVRSDRPYPNVPGKMKPGQPCACWGGSAGFTACAFSTR